MPFDSKQLDNIPVLDSTGTQTDHFYLIDSQTDRLHLSDRLTDTEERDEQTDGSDASPMRDTLMLAEDIHFKKNEEEME